MPYSIPITPALKYEADAFNKIDQLKAEGKIDSAATNSWVIEQAITASGKEAATWDEILILMDYVFAEVKVDIIKDGLLGTYTSTAEEIAAEVGATQKAIVPTIWDGLVTHLKTFSVDLWTWITSDVLGMTVDNFSGFLDKLIGKRLIDEETKSGALGMLKSFPKGSPWLMALMALAMIKTLMAVFISATGGTLMKRLNAEHTPNTPAPESVIRAAFLDPKLWGRVREVMAENGLSKEDQDLMFAANYATFDLGMIRELRNRGFIDDAKVKQYLDDSGYTPGRQEELVKLFQILPPLQDIATMMAKEAFEPDQVSRMGLGAELPGEFVKFAAQHGLSPEWATKYWIAHWQQPEIGLMFNAFQRRLISRETLQQHMKVVEIPPYLRDILTELAYVPLTRVDIRRMYEDGVLDLDQVYGAYLDHGYSPENAQLMTEWTVRYAEPNEKDLSRVQITKLYIDGQIGREDTITMLGRIGYPSHRAELLIVYAEYQEIKDLQDDQQKNIELLYKENWITKTQTRTELSKLDLSSERISLLIDKWTIQKAIPSKRPSKTDLDKFLRNEIIDRNAYYYEMGQLGYPPNYIDWYFQLVEKGKE